MLKLTEIKDTLAGKTIAAALATLLVVTLVPVGAIAQEGAGDAAATEQEQPAEGDAATGAQDATGQTGESGGETAAPGDALPGSGDAAGDAGAAGDDAAAPNGGSQGDARSDAGTGAGAGSDTGASGTGEQPAVDADATEVDVRLDFENAYIVVNGQQVNTTTKTIAVPTSRDFTFEAAAEDGYEISDVKADVNGSEVPLRKESDPENAYTLRQTFLAEGITLEVTAEAVESEGEGEAEDPVREPIGSIEGEEATGPEAGEGSASDDPSADDGATDEAGEGAADEGGQPSDPEADDEAEGGSSEEADDPAEAEDEEGEQTEDGTQIVDGVEIGEAEDVVADVEDQEVELYAYAGGVTVKVTAPFGALPEGARVNARLITAAQVEQAVRTAVEAGGEDVVMTDVVAIDVTIVDAEGNEIQPSAPVNVCFFNNPVQGDEISVYRVSDDATQVDRVSARQADASIQSFDVDHFTIYVVAAKAAAPRAEADHTVQEGKTISITGKEEGWFPDHRWSVGSGDGSVTLSNADGNPVQVTGVRAGTVTLIHEYKGSGAWYWNEERFVVEVTEPIKATSLTISPTDLELVEGATSMLSCTVEPGNAEVSWRSLDPNIATVDENGKVTAVKEGETTIYATSGSLTESCRVTVRRDTSNDSWQDAYFYFVYPGVVDPSGTEPGDWLYAGKGVITAPNPSAGASEITSGIDSIVVETPTYFHSKTITVDGTMYRYDAEGTGEFGTYSFEWDVVSAASGANNSNKWNEDAGKDNETIVNSGYTWHVDGHLILHSEKTSQVTFLVKEPGKTGFTAPVDTSGNTHRPFMIANGSDISSRIPNLAEEKQVGSVTYRFDGWYTEEACTRKATSLDFTNIQENKTFYARYTAEAVYVYKAGEGGRVSLEQETLEPMLGNAQGSIATPNEGYSFDGWYADDVQITSGNASRYGVELSDDGLKITPQKNSDGAYAGDTFEARFKANATKYTVEFYYQNNGTYGSVGDSVSRTSATNSEVRVTEADKTPTYPDYEFDAENSEQYLSGTVTADGSLVLKVYFKHSFTVTFEPGDHGTFSREETGHLGWNARTPEAPEPTGGAGYAFAGWKDSSGKVYGAGEALPSVTKSEIYTAQWEASEVTYTVEHRFQNVDDDEYSLLAGYEDQTFPGTTGELTQAEAHDIEGFTPKTIEQQTIAGDGTTVVTIYYDRNTYDVVYKIIGNHFADETYKTVEDVRYGASLSLISDKMEEEGYTWSGWEGLPETMPASDVEVTGSYAPVDLTVKFEWSTPVSGATTPKLPDPRATEHGATFDVSDYTNLAKDSQFKNEYGTWVFSGWVDKNGTAVSGSFTADVSLADEGNVITLKGTWEREAKSYVQYYLNAADASWNNPPETLIPNTRAHKAEGASSVTVSTAEGYYLDSSNYVFGEKVAAPAITEANTPSRPGYVFDGWKSDDGKTFDDSGTLDYPYDSEGLGDDVLTLKAQWKPAEVTISYEATEGGSVSKESDGITAVNADFSNVGVSATANAGYEFVGWKIDEAPVSIHGTDPDLSGSDVKEILDSLKGESEPYKSTRLTAVFQLDENQTYDVCYQISIGEVDSKGDYKEEARVEQGTSSYGDGAISISAVRESSQITSADGLKGSSASANGEWGFLGWYCDEGGGGLTQNANLTAELIKKHFNEQCSNRHRGEDGTYGDATFVARFREKTAVLQYNLVLDNAQWQGGTPEGMTFTSDGQKYKVDGVRYDQGDEFTVTSHVPYVTGAENYAFVGWFAKARGDSPAQVYQGGETATVNGSGSTFTLDALWVKLDMADTSVPYDGEGHSLIAAADFDTTGLGQEYKDQIETMGLVEFGEMTYRYQGADGGWIDVDDGSSLPVDVGTYVFEVMQPVTLKGAGSSTTTVDLTKQATLTITPRTLSVTAPSVEIGQGDSFDASDLDPDQLVVSGAVDGEVPGFAGGLACSYDPNAATFDETYQIERGSLILADNPDGSFEASNYVIEFTPGTLTVLPYITISFDDNVAEGEGSATGVPEPIRGLEGKSAGDQWPDSEPLREGYSFAGWYADSECFGEPVDGSAVTFPENDAIYYAKWVVDKDATASISYKVEPSGVGAPSRNSDIVQVVTGEGVSEDVAAPTNDGYRFRGWFVGGEKVSDQLTLPKEVIKDNIDKDGETGLYVDTDFTAIFAEKLSVTYSWTGLEDSSLLLYDEDGRLVDDDGRPDLPEGDVDIINGEPYVVDNLYSSGTTLYTHDAYGNVNGRYVFSGWMDADGSVVAGGAECIMGESGVTFNGAWTYESVEVAQYAVMYRYANDPAPTGAPALPADGSAVLGEPVTVAAAPTLSGWTFSGWSVATEGGDEIEIDPATCSFTMPDENVVITGMWTAVSAEFEIDDYGDYYDGVSHMLALSEGELQNGDKLQFVVDDKVVDAYSFKDVSDSGTVKAQVVRDGVVIWEDGVTIEVLPLPMTVTAPSSEKLYGRADPDSYGGISITCGVDGIEDAVWASDLAAIGQLNVVRTNNDEAVGDYQGVLAIEYENETAVEDVAEKLDEAYGNYAFTVVAGTFTIKTNGEGLTATAEDVVATYDGNPHTISIAVNASGVDQGIVDASDAEIKYWSDETNDYTEDEAPSWTDATYDENGEPEAQTVKFQVSLDGFEPVEGDAAVTVLKREVVLTSGSGIKEYDGETLAVDSVKATTKGAESEDQIWAKENVSYEVTGSQLTVGSSANTFSFTYDGETYASTPDASGQASVVSLDNYIVTLVEGQLTVTNRNAKYEVTITAKSDEKTYDGTPISVSGFENADENNRIKVYIDDKTFFVDVSELVSSATGTDVLDSVDKIQVTGSYAVCDQNDNNVTDQFNVVVNRGSLTIRPAQLTVTTPGASKVYDGEALTADGSIEGLAEKDGTFATRGKQTIPGSSENGYEITWKSDTAFKNYDVNDDGKFTSDDVDESIGTLLVFPQSINENDLEEGDPDDPEKPVYAGVTVDEPEPEIPYDGNEHKWVPTVIASDGKTALVEGQDYTVEYNTKDFIDVQEITVTITGTNGYGGTVVRTYKIVPASVTIAVSDAWKLVGDDDPQFEFGLLGANVQGLDPAAIEIARENGSEEVGVYESDLTIEYADARGEEAAAKLSEDFPNYAFTVQPGTFEIVGVYTVTYAVENGIGGSVSPTENARLSVKSTGGVTGAVGTAAQGYEFVGWYKQGEERALATDGAELGREVAQRSVNGSEGAYADTMFVAKFKPLQDATYTVHYVLESTGEKIQDDVVVGGLEFGKTYELDLAEHQITGYALATEAPVQVTAGYDASLPRTNEVTLEYTANTYTITYVITGDYFASEDGKPYKVVEDVEFGSQLSLIEDVMTEPGYVWSGWSELPETMPAEDITVTGSYSLATDTKYTVEHLFQTVDGTAYEEMDGYPDQERHGTTNSQTAAETYNVAGFTAQEVEQTAIAADGSTVVTVYYDRNKYPVEYVYDSVPEGASDLPQSVEYVFGSTVEVAPDATAPGYDFVEWMADPSVAVEDGKFIMPASNVTFTGSWAKDTEDKVDARYYVQYFVDGEKAGEAETVPTKAWAGDPEVAEFVEGSVVTDGKFEGYKFDRTDPAEIGETVAADSTISVYYVKDEAQTKTVSYSIVYTKNGVQVGDPVVVKDTVWVNEENPQIAIAEGGIPVPADKFKGFEPDQENPSYPAAGTLVDSGTVYTVNYVPKQDASYVVRYVLQGSEGTELAESDVHADQVYGASYTVSAKDIPGYTVVGSATQTAVAGYEGDSGRIVTFYYTANTGTPYYVEVYLQSANGGGFYMPSDRQIAYGTTGETAYAHPAEEPIAVGGFTYVFDEDNAGNVLFGTVVAGENPLTLKLHYKLQLSVTFEPGEYAAEGMQPQTFGPFDYDAAAPSAPEFEAEDGYEFVGWSDGVNTYPADAELPAVTGNVTYTAQWAALGGNTYKVQHFLQNLDGSWPTDPASTAEYHDGVTGETVQAVVGTFEGFTFDDEIPGSAVSGVVTADGGLVLKLYYTRNANDVVYSVTGDYFADPAYHVQEDVLYGTELSLAVSNESMKQQGYVWSGWSGLPETMPNGKVTVVGSYEPDRGNTYTVKHLFQTVDGEGYESLAEHADQKMAGTTGELTAAEALRVEGFTAVLPIEQATIAADGSTVVTVYYNRNVYEVSYDYGEPPAGATPLPQGGTYRFGATVEIAPAASAPGYTFTGWTASDDMALVGPEGEIQMPASGAKFSMPASNVEFVGTWTAIPPVVDPDNPGGGEDPDPDPDNPGGGEDPDNPDPDNPDNPDPDNPDPDNPDPDNPDPDNPDPDNPGGGEDPDVPGGEDPDNPDTPDPDDPDPDNPDPDNPGGEDPDNPDNPDDPDNPGGSDDPSGNDPDNPGGTTGDNDDNGTTTGGDNGGTTTPGGDTPRPVIPGGGPTPIDQTVSNIVTPLSSVMEDVVETVIPPAEETIADDETPLAGGAQAAHENCWVHYYMILGILISLVYFGAAGIRRATQTSSLKSFEDDVLGTAADNESR